MGESNKPQILVTVHGFKGSGVQGSILVYGVHLGCVFMRKASASSGLIQNLELNWQLLGKMSIFNDDFGSSIPSLSLTLNKYYLPVPFFCLFLKKGMGSRDSFTQISSIFHPSGKIKPPRSPSRHPRLSWPQLSILASELPPQHHEVEFWIYVIRICFGFRISSFGFPEN